GKWESLLREAQSLLHVITAAQYREAVQQLKGPSLADEARAALAKRPPTPLEKFSELDAQRREKELSKFVLTVGLVMGLMGFPFWVTGAGNLLVFAALVFFVVLGLTIDAVSSIGASRRIADLIRHRMNPQRPAASDGNAGNGGVL
ncbi:MAG: hypothetical protein KGK30_10125, partial [Elusimicrobia bacterium]|nr:hypothetical protein [Elusimicrobiota bacterium]